VPVDWFMAVDQFDSSTGMTVSIGILAGTPGDTTRLYTDAGTEAFASAAALRSQAIVRNTAVTWPRVAPSTADRSVVMVCTHAATTDVAATRILNFVMAYRWSRYGR
jgi:hypothetical protein